MTPHYQKFCCFGLPKRETIEPHSTDWCANVPLRSKRPICMITGSLQPGKYSSTFCLPYPITAPSPLWVLHSLLNIIIKLKENFILFHSPVSLHTLYHLSVYLFDHAFSVLTSLALFLIVMTITHQQVHCHLSLTIWYNTVHDM